MNSAPLSELPPPSSPAASIEPTPVSAPTQPVQPVPSAVPQDVVAPAAVSEPGDPLVSDEIVITARPSSRDDPLAAINAKSFAATQAIDKAVVGPIALAFQRTVPTPVRDGLRNFLNNLHEPVIALNFLLQLKPGKAAETLGRFAINSTVGGAGLFDVAKRKPFNLPRRPNGFADTLGFYGVKPGPFLFLPLVGATTPRDLLGGILDGFALPFAIGKPFNRFTYTVPTGALREVDNRAEFDDKLTQLRDQPDPYVALRRYYLEKRRAEIEGLRGGDRRAGTLVISPRVPIRADPNPGVPAGN
jgi:phospholipid-binding lipoprotein MlaA